MKVNRKAAIGALGASLAVFAEARIAGAADDTIRVGAIASDPGLEGVYAQQSGFAKRYGIGLQVQTFSNGSAIIAGLLGGSLDLGQSNWISIFQAHEKGLPIAAVAGAVMYTSKEPTTFIMVPTDSPAQSAKDLSGKTVAIDGLGNLTQLGVNAWIVKNGGDINSIKFVEIPFVEMPQALVAHRVDATLITEPLATSARNAGRIIGAPYDAIASEFPTSAWVATKEWTANRDRTDRLVKTIYSGAHWANTNRPLTANLLGQYSKLEPSTIQSMRRALFSERSDAALLQPLISAALRFGLIKNPVTARELYAGSA
jgi:NitT/TauT family transport system substrate-binding protein